LEACREQLDASLADLLTLRLLPNPVLGMMLADQHVHRLNVAEEFGVAVSSVY
jgi:hypothetical protein